jgi:hypothetical protein
MIGVLIKRADMEASSRSGPDAAPVRPMISSVADELKKLGELRDTGVLTTAEFQTQKSRILRAGSSFQ